MNKPRRKFNKNFKKKHHKKKKRDDDPTVAFVEITAEQCGGNLEKMIRKFRKKVRREEILKPFYTRLAYYRTKGELEREKRLKGEWLERKRQKKLEELEKDDF